MISSISKQPNYCLHIVQERLPGNRLLTHKVELGPHLSLHLILPPFYSAILKPDTYLCLGQAKLSRKAPPLLSRNILIDDKNVFQLVQLVSRKNGASSLGSHDFVIHEAGNTVFQARRICENARIILNNNN